MLTIQMPHIPDYELLDSGDGYKLERYGAHTIARPDPMVIWNKKNPDIWKHADAVFHKDKRADGKHWENKSIDDLWFFRFEQITMQLRMTPFKHTGLFPEQIANWLWMKEKLSGQRDVKVLNLFGYTGGATLFLASQGAIVTHVDASKPSITWARENQRQSGLGDAPIRWIVDDAQKFVAREARRGMVYDAVLLDPPAFGRDPKGKVFQFEKDVPLLLENIKRILSPTPLFVLLNSYSMGYSPVVLENLFTDYFPPQRIESGELQILEKNGRALPCSVFARYSEV
ncbi:MAG: class I SAM-dependent methyltransferase [Candidatus Paceibacterota bacterium]|jgi:23S rRNA (cytosine1962-C5)-methyltransferase